MDNETTSTDEILIAALATGLSHAAAGELVGCSTKTVQRRLAEPEFATAVASARAERIDRIVGELVDLGSVAVGVIREAMEPSEPMRTRLMAATASLKQLREFRSGAELERRLSEVEELAARLAAAAMEVRK